MKELKDRFIKYWNNIQPERKRKIVLLSLITLIVLVGLLAYTTSRPKQEKVKEPEKKEIKFDSKVMEKSLYMESKKEIEQMRKEFDDFKKQLEEEKKKKQEEAQLSIPKLSHSDQTEKTSPLPPPPPPLPPLPEPAQEQKPSPPTIEKMGDITIFTASVEIKEKDTIEEVKKKAETIYLPPSFMEAMLLSGLDAPTVEAGRSHPVPVLLRIKDLAVLPNRVKANLKGCFVIAEGFGDLSTERANLRLVTLSCLSKGGKAVIDQAVKGFVVDTDGKIGLKGKVVSKMGSTIARAALAGFFGGLGDAITSAYTTTSVSLAGTTSQVKSEDVGRVAAGKGISSGVKELEKFYLELAKQAMPVIEVGATKTVTLVISEGVQLKILDIDTGISQDETQGGSKQKTQGEQGQQERNAKKVIQK